MTTVFWVLAAGQLAGCVVAAVLRLPVPAAVAAALAWENAVIAAGARLGAGDLLAGLSVPRFVAHALLTPLLIPAAWRIAGLRRRPWLWVLTGVLIGFGCWADVVRLRLAPEAYAGTLRYVNADALPPIPAVLTILFVIGCGVLVWRRRGSPWLCLGGVLMFAGAATGVPVAGNGGELLLIAGLLATAAYLTPFSPSLISNSG